VAIVEKQLPDVAVRALGQPRAGLEKAVAALGAKVGAPWGKDQKEAALAAWVGLRARGG
jgi:tetrahydromethanopterin S-methyltransferase subunit H